VYFIAFAPPPPTSITGGCVDRAAKSPSIALGHPGSAREKIEQFRDNDWSRRGTPKSIRVRKSRWNSPNRSLRPARYHGALVIKSVLVAIAMMALTLVYPSAWLAGLAYVTIGIGSLIWVVTTQTLRQTVAPPGMIGRLSAITIMATAGARPLGAGPGVLSHPRARRQHRGPHHAAGAAQPVHAHGGRAARANPAGEARSSPAIERAGQWT